MISTRLRHSNDSKAFIQYSNDMDNIYKIIEEYNPSKKRKMSVIFDDMIANMLRNEKVNSVVTELFIRDRKLIISLLFITQYYFGMSKNARLNSTHHVMKTPKKQKVQQIVFNH